MSPPVLYEISDGVAVITLNRPEAANAMSRAMRRELAAAFGRASSDEAVRAVVLTGAGERAFTAGVDLKEVAQEGFGAPDPATDPGVILAACAKPVIGAINGVAITGGFELALACDILIASTNARFADTHVMVKVVPGWGLSQRLSRMIGPSRAKELSLSGRMIDAATALAWGLVNRVVAPEALMPEALALAEAIAANDPAMVSAYKALIDDGYALPFGQAMQLEKDRSAAHMQGFRPADLAQDREAIQARNRAQLSGDR